MAQQIRNGFNRAWITIFDSHVTIFLSGLVLYAVGTEEVKGFALTLIIGMIWNLFTAVYVSRVIFDFWYAQGWLKQAHDAEDDGQDQHRLHRPPQGLHGRLGDRDRPRPGRDRRAGSRDVQHRLHRRHAGDDPAERARPARSRS